MATTSDPSTSPLSSNAHITDFENQVVESFSSNLDADFVARYFGDHKGDGSDKIPCALGIDEAGRGPVLGPMVYGAAWCPVERHKGSVKRLGVMDSKMLSAGMREVCFSRIVRSAEVSSSSTDAGAASVDTESGVMARDPIIGWAVIPLHAHDLSQDMLRMNKVNLNAISHNAAIALIQTALDAGVHVTEVYVDTVGQAKKYESLLRSKFPGIPKIVVESKADATFPIVSAASICAKVIRDNMLRHWAFVEPGLGTQRPSSADSSFPLWEFGSGYPSDPNTKSWLRANLDPVFGFPRVLRFSWKTAGTLIKKGGYDVVWGAYDDDGEEEEGDTWADGPQQRRRSQKKKKENLAEDESRVDRDSLLSAAARKRYRFFAERNMERTQG